MFVINVLKQSIIVMLLISACKYKCNMYIYIHKYKKCLRRIY